MTIYFVSRHPGASEWASDKGMTVDRQIEHLDPGAIMYGAYYGDTLPFTRIKVPPAGIP